MHVNDTDIERFQALYTQFFGIEIDANKARQELLSLVELVYVTCQPITHEQLIRLWTKNEYEDKKYEPIRAASNI